MLKNLLSRVLSSPPATPAPAPEPPSPDAPTAAAIEAAPPPPAAPPPTPEEAERANALVAQGNALEDAGQLAQAEGLCREAIGVAPGHARPHLTLGIVLAARAEVEGARAAYEQVLAIEPEHAFGNDNYARLALLHGDLGRAETLIDTALCTKPNFPQALAVRSNLLDVLGRRAAAIEAIQAALQMQPEDPRQLVQPGVIAATGAPSGRGH